MRHYFIDMTLILFRGSILACDNIPSLYYGCILNYYYKIPIKKIVVKDLFMGLAHRLAKAQHHQANLQAWSATSRFFSDTLGVSLITII